MTTNTAIQSLLIDNREPPWMAAIRIDGAPTLVTQLACGDAWIAAGDGALLIVERKTTDDLLASIADGRLFDQAAAMIGLSPWSYIVVQGTVAPAPNGKTLSNGSSTGWQWSAVQGALQTVQEMGVAVVYLNENPVDFIPFLQRLAGRARGKVRVGGARQPELLMPGMAVLMSLPGVGIDRAKALMEQAGTAGFALSCLTDDTLNVIGIGDGTRAKVREALGLEAGQKIEII